MKVEYERWILEGVSNTPGACANVTRAMSKAFPELTRTRGHYICPIWGRRQHWWMVDVDGLVVDPTVLQFPSRGLGEYEPWIEGAEEPVGKCMVCGSLSFPSKGGDDASCSEACRTKLEQEYGAPRCTHDHAADEETQP